MKNLNCQAEQFSSTTHSWFGMKEAGSLETSEEAVVGRRARGAVRIESNGSL